MYVDGKYEEAKAIWEEVIDLNSNYDIAYHAIGKALHNSEQYEEAMAYFKLANARDDYSAAFRDYRVEFVRENFSWFFGGVIILFVFLRFCVPFVIKRFKRKKKQHRINEAAISRGRI